MKPLDQINTLKQSGLSFSQIARALTEDTGSFYSKDKVQKIYKRSLHEAARHYPTDQIREWLGTTLNVKRPSSMPSEKRIIVAVGDLHGLPHPAFLPRITAVNPDVLVIGGDLFDQALFSSHAPTIDEKQEEFYCELTRLRAWLEVVLEQTHAQVRIIRGNHDDRVWRQVIELVPKHLHQFFQDPLDLLIAGLPPSRISLTKNAVEAHRPGVTPAEWGIVRHLEFLGDAVISHAHFASAEKFYYNWLNKMRRPLGLPDTALVVQFHTHQFSHVIAEGGYLTLIEPGMIAASSAEAYKLSPSGKWRIGTQGAVAFTQTCLGGLWTSDYRAVVPIWPAGEIVVI